jgi:hypothetical protein
MLISDMTMMDNSEERNKEVFENPFQEIYTTPKNIQTFCGLSVSDPSWRQFVALKNF